MVAQLLIYKEMCIFHSCIHYFVHPLEIESKELGYHNEHT